MISTIFAIFNIEAMSSGTLLGYGLLLGMVLAIAITSQRWLLWYVFGGMMYWTAVEVIQSLVSGWLVLSEWHTYIVAMGISWLPLAVWVLYRALRYEDVSQSLQQQRQQQAARYVEHSPVYDDDYTPRFQ